MAKKKARRLDPARVYEEGLLEVLKLFHDAPDDAAAAPAMKEAAEAALQSHKAWEDYKTRRLLDLERRLDELRERFDRRMWHRTSDP